MIWAVNRYVQRYRLKARTLASTHLWAAPWIRLRRASHYSIIKIIRQLDNSQPSPWLYILYIWWYHWLEFLPRVQLIHSFRLICIRMFPTSWMYIFLYCLPSMDGMYDCGIINLLVYSGCYLFSYAYCWFILLCLILGGLLFLIMCFLLLLLLILSGFLIPFLLIFGWCQHYQHIHHCHIFLIRYPGVIEVLHHIRL